MVLLVLDDFGWQHEGLKEKMIRRKNITQPKIDANFNFPNMIEDVRYGTFDTKVKAVELFKEFVCQNDNIDYEPREFVACGLISEFVDLLQFEETHYNASTVLMNLSASSYVAYELVEAGVIKQLMKNVTTIENEGLISQLLFVISNTAVESRVLCTTIVEMGLWDVIFSIYQKRPYGEHVVALATTISNILRYLTIDKDIQKQVFSLLTDLQKFSAEEINESTIESIYRLCTDREQIQALIDSKLLKGSFKSFPESMPISKRQIKIMKKVASIGSDTQKEYLYSIAFPSAFEELFKGMGEEVKHKRYGLSIIDNMLEVNSLSEALIPFTLELLKPYMEDVHLKTEVEKCIAKALTIRSL